MMKLAVLKNKFRNRYMIRILAGILTVAVIGGSSTCLYQVYGAKSTDNVPVNGKNVTKDTAKAKAVTAEQTYIGKEETVYLIADNTGTVESAIVSEWLKNKDGRETIEDRSSLTDITNVKGDEVFTQSGDKLIWNAAGNDIYYQGSTTKEAPITEKITYYLDGKEIVPQKLAHKSGKVKIRFDYTNSEKTAVEINGKQEEIYVPFVALSSMVLKDNFTNIEVTNGKIVSDGKNNVVVGITMPGLRDSLQVKEEDFSKDITIPDYFEVTADVKDFSLEMTMSAAASSADLSIDQKMDLSEVDQKIKELSDGTKQLLDGSGDLAKGMDTLKDSIATFSGGMDTLKNGLETYTQGTSQMADGISTLKNQSSTLISGVGTISSSAAAINNGVKQLDKALNTKMTERETAAAGKQAETQAVQAVEAQFADDTNPQSYDNLKNYAAQTFYDTVASQDTLNGAAALAKETAAGQIAGQADGIAAQASEAARGMVSSQMGTDPAIAGQMESLRQAIVAAGVVSAAQSMGTDSIAAVMGDGAVMAQITENANNTVASLQNIIIETAGSAASETAKSVAGQVAPEAAGAAAKAAVQGVADSARDSVGNSVAQAAKSAAETAAGSAAGQAAVAGAENAKSQIAAQIEAKDSKTGYSLVSGMDALDQGISQMSENMPALSSGIDSLYSGSQQLVSGNGTLNGGAGQLTAGTGELVKGIDALKDGSHKLSDGIIEFNEDGIEKLIYAYNGNVKSLIDRIQAVMDAGSSYETFSGKSENTTGSVRFIIRTDAIK